MGRGRCIFALEKLREIPEVVLYGSTDPADAPNRLGVISLNVKNLPHALTAAILSHEGAIGVRSGCFCAHTYVKELLKIGEKEARELEMQILARDRSQLPGTIRMSFGIYNTRDEIDRFLDMIRRIAAGKFEKGYVLNKEKGEYTHPGLTFEFPKFFDL